MASTKFLSNLVITGANGTVLDVQGSVGQLFSVTDSLTGDLFAVSDISGIPILNVNSNGAVDIDGTLNLGDNNKIQLGASQDLQIYHDGSNSYISEVGSGDLIISADNDLTFKDGSGNIMANMNASNSVELMYGNVKKFETTSTGVTVTGALTADNLFLGSSSVRVSPGTNGEIGLNYNTSATGSLVWYAGGTASKFSVTNAGNATFAGTIGATNFSGSSSGTNTGDQTLPTASSLGAVTLTGTQTITGIKNFGTIVPSLIKDSLYYNGESTNWRTQKYIRNVGISGGSINDSWVQLSRVVISSTYEKVTIKFTINGYDDVSSGVEAIDVRYENGSAAQENHQCAWYSTDDHANLFKDVRSIRSASDGLSNTYDLYVQMAGDWRDNFTVVAESWTTHGDNASIVYPTAAGTATEPTAGDDDKNNGERRWYTENSYMYLGGNRVYTTGDFTNNASNWDTAYGWGNHAGLYLGATAKAADSNLLDGVDSTSFLRSDASDSFSGILTGTANGENLKIGGIRGTAKGSQTGEYIHLYERVHIGGPSGWGAATHGAPGSGLSTWGSVDFGMNGSGVIQLDGTTIVTSARALTNVTNTNWDTAYTYSQVGHLPLAGGTMTGALSGTTATFSGGGNTLLLKKGTGTPALAFAGTATDPEASALIEGISGGGLKFYTSNGGTLATPAWSPKLTISAAGDATFEEAVTTGGKLYIGSTDATSTAVTALFLGAAGEVKKRALGSNAFNSTTIPTGTASSKAVTDFIQDFGTSNTSDINAIGNASGKYRWNNTTTGRPASSQANEYGTLLNLHYFGNVTTQIAHDIDQANLWIRSLNTESDTGTAWKQIADTAYVSAAVAGIVDSAPATLDTLNELAAALGDDASFSTTMSTALGNRLRIDVNNQSLSSTELTNARTNLGLGTAAATASTAYATSTQGAKADAALPKAGGTMTGGLTGTTAIFNSGAAYPLRTSSAQRYGIQVRNTANTVNANYGWWWFMDTDFNMGFHADGAADRFTLTRAGNLTVSGDIAASNFSGSSSGTNTGDQDLSGYTQSTDVAFTVDGNDVIIGDDLVLAGGLTWTNSTKTLTSANDNTTYTAGTGLTLTGTEFSVTASTYATATQGATADAALPKAGGAMTGDIDMASGSGITFYGNGNGNHGIFGKDSSGTASDDIRINSYHNVHIVLDTNSNNTSSTTFFSIGEHGGEGAIGSQVFSVSGEGDVKINSALLSNQENTDVDTGTETVATVAHAAYTAAFFDFVIKNGTNVRAGTVYSCHDGTNVEFTETSTVDLGDTSDVTLAVDISGTDMRLRATTTSDNWIIKSLVRAI